MACFRQVGNLHGAIIGLQYSVSSAAADARRNIDEALPGMRVIVAVLR
jgi:hypothetical protein